MRPVAAATATASTTVDLPAFAGAYSAMVRPSGISSHATHRSSAWVCVQNSAQLTRCASSALPDDRCRWLTGSPRFQLLQQMTAVEMVGHVLPFEQEPDVVVNRALREQLADAGRVRVTGLVVVSDDVDEPCANKDTAIASVNLPAPPGCGSRSRLACAAGRRPSRLRKSDDVASSNAGDNFRSDTRCGRCHRAR